MKELGKPIVALAATGVLVLGQAAPASAYWVQTANRDRSYFIEKGAVNRKLANSTTAGNRYVPAGTRRFDGAKQVVSKAPRETRTDLKNPYQETLKDGVYTVTKLVRSDKWNDVQYQTPWTLYSMKQRQEQKTLYFTLEWTDPVRGTVIREPDPKTDLGPWTDLGAPEKDQVVGTGSDLWDHLVKEDPRSENQEVTLARVPLSLASNDAVAGKSSVFTSDRGQAGGATLSGSKLRATLKANEAIASTAKAPEPARGSGGMNVALPPGQTNEQISGAAHARETVEADLAKVRRKSAAAFEQRLDSKSWHGTWMGHHKVHFWAEKNGALNYSFDKLENHKGGELSSDKTSFRDEKGNMNASLRLDRVKGELRLRGTVSIETLLGKRTYELDLGK